MIIIVFLYKYIYILCKYTKRGKRHRKGKINKFRLERITKTAVYNNKIKTNVKEQKNDIHVRGRCERYHGKTNIFKKKKKIIRTRIKYIHLTRLTHNDCIL